MSEGASWMGEPEDGLLGRARAQGWISSLDHRFASRLAALCPGSDDGVRWALAVACRQEAAGHVCADLARLAQSGLAIESEAGVLRRATMPAAPAPDAELAAPAAPVLLTHPTLAAWLAALAGSPLVERVPSPEASPEASFDVSPEVSPEVSDGQAGTPGATAKGATPLVLDGAGRLYLRRAWVAEGALASRLAARIAAADLEVDHALAEEGVRRLVPAGVAAGAGDDAASGAGDDAPRAALRAGLLRPLAVVTGGPGTGKTTMVARLVALLAEQHRARGQAPPRVRLLAPTGKAAAALSTAFGRQRGGLDVSEEIREALPATAETIHRALHRGTRRDAFGRARAIRLEADVVVVDEASMVDLATMARLFEACDDVERVVLLGDPDQLASVESGAVLAELCSGAAPALGDSLVRLQTSHRFRGEGGIGLLAAAIREGDADAALALLADPDRPEVERCEADSIEAVRGRLVERARGLQAAIGEVDDAAEKLERLARYRVLCAHRRGPLGVEALCALLDEVAATARRTGGRSGWFRGRLLLVTRNAPEQDLWNGDVGLVEETSAGLVVLFPDAAGGARVLAAGRLPAHESAIAMSVHKSQGSEFDEVDLVLGERASPLMTRELLYTGVTRARERLRIHASEGVLRAAIGRRIERDSALALRLRGGGLQ